MAEKNDDKNKNQTPPTPPAPPEDTAPEDGAKAGRGEQTGKLTETDKSFSGSGIEGKKAVDVADMTSLTGHDIVDRIK